MNGKEARSFQDRFSLTEIQSISLNSNLAYLAFPEY